MSRTLHAFITWKGIGWQSSKEGKENMTGVLVFLVLVVLVAGVVSLWLRDGVSTKSVSDTTDAPQLSEEDRKLLSRMKPLGGIKRNPRPTKPRRRQERRKRRKRLEEIREAARKAAEASYGHAASARALRITGGELPNGSHGLCRLTKWGKNHHLDETGNRTLCGQDALSRSSVNWKYGWCVQCDDVLEAMEFLGTGAVA